MYVHNQIREYGGGEEEICKFYINSTGNEEMYKEFAKGFVEKRDRKILEEEIQHSELEESYRVHYKSILEKIKKIIPYSEAKENETVRLLIEEAIQKKKKITFLYTGWKSNEKESRIVDPWFIFTEKNEYLVAYCNDRKGRNTAFIF